MTNPYDQFDDNPYDQFDGPATTPKKDARWRDLPSNIGPSAGRLAGNMWHAVTHPVESAAALRDISGGATLNALGMVPFVGAKARDALVENSEWGDDPEALKRMISAANALGGVYVERYGSPAAIKHTMVNDPAGFAADLSTVFTGAGGVAKAAGTVAAKTGATGAARVASTASKVATKAGNATNPINYVTKPVGWVANKTGVAPTAARIVRNVADAHIIPENLNPLRGPVRPLAIGPTRVAQNALAMNAAEHPVAVLNALRSGPHQIVPGSNPTAAQAVAPHVDATRLAAVGQKAEKNLSTESRGIEAEQNAARLADIRDIGRDHTITSDQITRASGPGYPGHVPIDPATATRAELEHALANADAHNYTPVDRATLLADDALIDLFERPVVRDVFEQARVSAENAGRQFQIGNNVPAHTVPSSVVGPNGQPVMIYVPAQYAQYQGRDLSFIKKAFDDAISVNTKEYGAGSAKVRDIRNARREFIDWVETHLPEHRTAREDSAAWNRLIDRRRASEVFEDALTGPLEGENIAAQRSASFGNLLGSPRNAVKGNAAVGKATGFNYDQWDELLTPRDLHILERNRLDLARLKETESQAKAGSAHGGMIETAASDAFLGGLPAQSHPITNWMMGGINDRVYNNMSNAMLTPEGLEQVLTEAIARYEQVNGYANGARWLGNGVRDINRFPAGYNALEYDRNERKKRNALVE